MHARPQAPRSLLPRWVQLKGGQERCRGWKDEAGVDRPAPSCGWSLWVPCAPAICPPPWQPLSAREESASPSASGGTWEGSAPLLLDRGAHLPSLAPLALLRPVSRGDIKHLEPSFVSSQHSD